MGSARLTECGVTTGQVEGPVLFSFGLAWGGPAAEREGVLQLTLLEGFRRLPAHRGFTSVPLKG